MMVFHTPANDNNISSAGAYVMLRTPYEDTVLSASGLTPTSDTITIPKGADVVLDVIGSSMLPFTVSC